MRKAIQPGLKLALTLHHLSEGASHASIAAHYRLGRSTTSQITYDKVDALWRTLQPIYLKPPSRSTEWEHVAEGYAIVMSIKTNCIILSALKIDK